MASEVALVMAIPVRREDERIEQTYIFFGTSSYDFCPYFTGKNLVARSYLTATRVGMTDDLKYLVCISFLPEHTYMCRINAQRWICSVKRPMYFSIR